MWLEFESSWLSEVESNLDKYLANQIELQLTESNTRNKPKTSPTYPGKTKNAEPTIAKKDPLLLESEWGDNSIIFDGYEI